MTEVPLFPLNTVVFPGVVTPLHIFEERYRALVRELAGIESVFDRVFGILAIREGYEVGDHGMQSAHRIGTLVQLTELEAYDDGRFDIEVIGRQRLRVVESDSSGPFLRGEVELLTDEDEPAAVEEAGLALATFEVYREQLSDLRGGPVLAGEMPSDPAYLSYALASTCLLTLPQRQALLEAETRAAATRHVAPHAARGDARDARPALPPRHRGRPDPLVPQLIGAPHRTWAATRGGRTRGGRADPNLRWSSRAKRADRRDQGRPPEALRPPAGALAAVGLAGDAVAVVVDPSVVVTAQEASAVEVGNGALGPGDVVMCVTHRRRAVAVLGRAQPCPGWPSRCLWGSA